MTRQTNKASAPARRPRTTATAQPGVDVGSPGAKPAPLRTPAPATVSRGILEDRYDGAIDRRTKPGNYSRLGQDLANAVHEVIARTARLEDGRDLAGTGGVEGAVLDAIRDIVIREIDDRGLAR